VQQFIPLQLYLPSSAATLKEKRNLLTKREFLGKLKKEDA